MEVPYMTRILTCLALATALSLPAFADDKAKAAIGGGVGGAIGAVIGEELGDREGAIIGAGVGAAVGAAIATDGSDADKQPEKDAPVIVVQGHEPPAHGRHCPPGQAKKGRC